MRPGCFGPVRVGGSEEQKKEWLAPCADAFKLISFCLSEPGAGSDVAGLQLHADRSSNSDARMYLKTVRVEEVFEAGSVKPAFKTDRLIHQMYPHELVESSRLLRFVYVNHDGAVEKSLYELFGLVIEDADHHD